MNDDPTNAEMSVRQRVVPRREAYSVVCKYNRWNTCSRQDQKLERESWSGRRETFRLEDETAVHKQGQGRCFRAKPDNNARATCRDG
jgi:hypothetical protein